MAKEALEQAATVVEKVIITRLDEARVKVVEKCDPKAIADSIYFNHILYRPDPQNSADDKGGVKK